MHFDFIENYYRDLIFLRKYNNLQAKLILDQTLHNKCMPEYIIFLGNKLIQSLQKKCDLFYQSCLTKVFQNTSLAMRNWKITIKPDHKPHELFAIMAPTCGFSEAFPCKPPGKWIELLSAIFKFWLISWFLAEQHFSLQWSMEQSFSTDKTCRMKLYFWDIAFF